MAIRFSSRMPYTATDLDFATLTPVDRRTAQGLQMVIDNIQDQGQHDTWQHHAKFVQTRARQSKTAAAAIDTNKETSSDSVELSSSLGLQLDDSADDDDEEFLQRTVACYVLSLDPSKLPSDRRLGWGFGVGDMDKFPHDGGVDLLLPPSNFQEPTTKSAPNSVRQHHGHIMFDIKHGSLWISARHSGIKLDDRSMRRNSKSYLRQHMRISIGLLRFEFAYTVADEHQSKYQFTLRNYLESISGHRSHAVTEATSATPSENDVYIKDWVLHGIVGSSATSVIHAASNTRTAEVVAVKRLRFGESRKRAEAEVKLYDEILRDIEHHRYSVFVMQKRDVLVRGRQQRHRQLNEVYLLWKPLARLGDFNQFSGVGQWRDEAKETKLKLFVQIALGLSALHESGWIHRDIKPANLGIVELGEAPVAVIMDEGQARRQNSKDCQNPRPGVCGTVGFLAPELENEDKPGWYGPKVDVWSLGAVACVMFVTGCIPWGGKHNMFLTPKSLLDDTVEVFRIVHADLLRKPESSLENCIGLMLTEDPNLRPDIQGVLEHPALRVLRSKIDTTLESASMSAGSKRKASTMSAGVTVS